MSESKKASNGAGSMRYIESKKLYCYRVTVGTDSLGKPIRKAFYAKTEKETRQKGIAAQARVMQGQAATSSAIKIKDWADTWLKTYKKNLSPRTVANYTEIVNKMIVPNIGQYALKNIKPLHVQKMIVTLIDGGYAKRTIGLVKTLTNAMLETAIDNELLIKNPCRKIKIPEMERPAEKIPFTDEEIKKLIEFMPNYLSLFKPHNPRIIGRMIIILLKTGMRQEELLGLRWEDIDFKKNVINIQRAVTVEKGRPLIKDTKTATSTRSIPMHAEVCQQLKEIGIREKGYIFCNHSEELIKPDNFRRDYKEFLIKAGVEYRSPHICRHTFASQLRAKGVDIKTISQLLGHSEVDVTLNVYTHTTSEDEVKAVNSL